MVRVHCAGCGRDVAIHELETKTVAQRSGFETRYRCPFCHEEVEDVADSLG
jgi:DNA-directed RNA polymerase subunit RPC12/RpoP